MSIMIETSKNVEVRNNQFSMNAHQVISYKDGSSVFISCNRMLGDFVKPECIPTTTTTKTTTTTTKITTTATRRTTTVPTTMLPIVIEKETEGSSVVVIVLGNSFNYCPVD